MIGESSTDGLVSFVSVWQFIRDGAISIMGLLSIIMQIVLIAKLDVIYAGAGIWFGVVALLAGIAGIYACKKRTHSAGMLWLFLAIATLFVSIGPMYFSALGWAAASLVTANTNLLEAVAFDQLQLVAGLSGVMFFCGLLSAIFSLFSACSAGLVLYEIKMQRSSPYAIHVRPQRF